MSKKIIRLQIASVSSTNQINNDDVDMKKIVLIEIFKTKISFAVFYFI